MHDELDPGDAFRARLRDAADQHPTATPDVGRAMATARRRGVVKAAGTGLLVAAVATTAVAATSLLQPVQVTQPAVPADSSGPTSEPSPTIVEPTPVPASSIRVADLAALCRPQFEALAGYPMYVGVVGEPGPRVVYPHRTYAPGDFVAFRYGVERTDDPFVLPGDIPSPAPTTIPFGPSVMCQLPRSAGETPDPTLMTPSALSDKELLSFCSQLSGRRLSAPDLRDATLVQRASAGDVAVALAEFQGETWACTSVPQVWDLPDALHPVTLFDDVEDPYLVAESAAATGAAAKSIVDDDAVYVTAAGVLPDDAATIRVTLAGGASQMAEVGADGRFVLAMRFEGLSGIPDYVVEVLDASGSVLSTQERGH